MFDAEKLETGELARKQAKCAAGGVLASQQLPAAADRSSGIQPLGRPIHRVQGGGTEKPRSKAETPDQLDAVVAVRAIREITVSEIGTFRRFERPKMLIAFPGLVPSEDSSGTSRRQVGLDAVFSRFGCALPIH